MAIDQGRNEQGDNELWKGRSSGGLEKGMKPWQWVGEDERW